MSLLNGITIDVTATSPWTKWTVLMRFRSPWTTGAQMNMGPVNTGIEDGQQWIRWSHERLPSPEDLAFRERFCRAQVQNPELCIERYPKTFTFVLQYRVRGGLHLDEAGDMVYWKALFKDRDADIRSGSVTVRLPESLAGRISEYRSFGEPATASQTDPRTVVFTTDGVLRPGRELEVQVAFPHGLLNVPAPAWQQKAERAGQTRHIVAWAFRGLGAVGMLLVVFLSLKRLTWPSVQYPKYEGVIEPPSDLPAPAVSVLESRKVTPRTILAMIVEMCQKGALQVVGEEDSRRPGRGKITYRLTLNGAPQFEWERSLFDSFPQSGTTVAALKKRLMAQRENIGNQLGEHLQHRGLFENNPVQAMAKSRHGLWMALWVPAAVTASSAGVGLWLDLLELSDRALVSSGLISLVLCLLASFPSRIGSIAPTAAELGELGRWRGFAEDLPTLTRGTGSDQPDTLLPYAIALGVAERRIPVGADAPYWFDPAEHTPATRFDRNSAYRSFLVASAWDAGSFGGGSGGGGGGGGGGG